MAGSFDDIIRQVLGRVQYDTIPTPVTETGDEQIGVPVVSDKDEYDRRAKMNARMVGEQYQGHDDADIILKAMMERERLGRK